jgi:hypothetical protein
MLVLASQRLGVARQQNCLAISPTLLVIALSTGPVHAWRGKQMPVDVRLRHSGRKYQCARQTEAAKKISALPKVEFL